MIIVPCNDINLLSEMYIELSEDERADIQRTNKQYKDVMEWYLKNGDLAFKFEADGKTVGYALVISDEKPLYLRHFYICRSARRKGCGTLAFNLLLSQLKTSEIDLDVFVWNERGKAFWESLGFEHSAIIMRYKKPHMPVS